MVEMETINIFKWKLDGHLKEINLQGYGDRVGSGTDWIAPLRACTDSVGQMASICARTGHYKQCAMKRSREECGCTAAMKLSSLIAYSDCRERVYRLFYPVNDLFIKIYLKKSDHVVENLRTPYFVTITELNNRTNWRATSTKIDPSFVKFRQFWGMSITMHNPDGLIISLFGSELYHFRVTVIPGVSFCNLVEEFQLYVDDPPMAYPFHYLVSMITAIGLGALIMLYFFLQHFWNGGQALESQLLESVIRAKVTEHLDKYDREPAWIRTS
ncbi:cation channel sperm-associated auxiliary subunit beta-like [Heterodontus francisci]|uniref:cation channel sperm-associated auxiliary subunit beta-like n=1 Tax=Heterodontus francisci TaxID=7792 RepID=UPI00355B2656